MSRAVTLRRRVLRSAAGALGALLLGPARAQRATALTPGAARPPVSPDDKPLARIDDLQPLLLSVARDRRPLLLFFTTPGCPYCREVRRSYLRPRVEEGELASGVMIREVEMTSGRRLRDANGAPVTESELGARYGVKMVPHLELVDAKGERLVKPLIGLDSSGFYESFLQTAIGEATARLRP